MTINQIFNFCNKKKRSLYQKVKSCVIKSFTTAHKYRNLQQLSLNEN